MEPNNFKIPISKEDITDKDTPSPRFGPIDEQKTNKGKTKNLLIPVKKKVEEPEYGKKSHFEFVNKIPKMQPKGKLRPISMKEVEQHNTKDSLWTVLDGKVYDLTSYLDYHPGGERKLMMGAGSDCTSLFCKT